MRVYYTKQEALDNISAGEFLYAQDHINNKNRPVKKFFTATLPEILELLKNDSYIYEHYGYNTDPVKLFIDIDYEIHESHYTNDTYDNEQELLNSICSDFEAYMTNNNHNYTTKTILNASNSYKYSFHVIYNDVIFANMNDMNKYVKTFLDSVNEKYDKIVDNTVYGNRCLRCVNQSKISKHNPLLTTSNIIDTLLLHNQGKPTVQLQNDNPITERQKTVKHAFAPIQVQIENNELVEILDMLAPERSDDYDDWIKVMFALKNGGDSNFHIFDWFSRKSAKYNYEHVKYMWNTNTKRPSYTYQSLLYWAKQDNNDKYMEFRKKQSYAKRDELMLVGEVHYIENNHLLPLIKDDNDLVCQVMDKYIIEDIRKALVVDSTYNTGKTSLLSVLSNFYPRVLYVSYRVSLSNNISGVIKDMVLYTVDINAPKLICQVDSLKKLTCLQYDVIIFDESTSLLAHLSAPTLREPDNAYEIMTALIHNAKKVVFLDGDIDNRTMHMVKEINTIMLINKIKKDTRHFKFRRNEKHFIQQLSKDLKNGRNIVLIIMSESKANAYYEEFKDKYNTIKYTSKTSDIDKKDLCRVEEIWDKVQLLIYTSTIEAGVSFNKHHFHKQYIIISSRSACQRGLIQMMNRVRKFEDDVVECLCHNIPIKETTNSDYTYDEMLMFYNTISNSHDTIVNDDGIIEYVEKKHYSAYDMIKLYNQKEILNKSEDCFIPLLIQMLRDKGHTCSIEDDKKCNIKDELNYDMKVFILDADSINEEQYKIRLKKQRDMMLFESEKWEMCKYEYETLFETKMDSMEVITKFYNKMNMINNALLLLGVNSTIYDDVGTYRINATKELMGVLGINGSELFKGKLVPGKYIENITATIADKINNNKIAFDIDKKINIKTYRSVLHYLKEIFNNYGIEMVRDRKTKQNEKLTLYCVKIYDEVQNKIKKITRRFAHV